MSASSSSINTIHGLLAAALSNTSLTFFSLYPMYIFKSYGPFTLMKPILHSFAIHLPNKVLPVPGGPKNSKPVLGLIHSSNISGCFVGNRIVCIIYSLAVYSPPTSSQLMLLMFSTFYTLVNFPISFSTTLVFIFDYYFYLPLIIVRTLEKTTHPKLLAARLITYY